MTPITRIALCVFAVFVGLLLLGGVTSRFVGEARPTPSLVGDARDWRPSPGNHAHLALLELSTDERGEVLRTEIHVAGFICDRVQRTFPCHYQEGSRESASRGDISDGVEFWHAACRDGHAYFIAVWTDGATKVFPCGVLNDADRQEGQIDCSNSRF